MTPEEWARIKAIVTDALAQTADRRAGYVAERCGTNESARREAESLLTAAAAAEAFYDQPTLLIDGTPASFADAFEHLPAQTPPSLHELLRDGAPLNRPAALRPFHGTSRYGVRRQIGVGGMGIVYEVDDRLRKQTVALKTLRRWDAADIYRLKREFRSLADIAHPNLVSLHELVVDEGQCFFTMELVDGLNYVDYVRESGTLNPDRVRRTLPQLIDGLEELHRRGRHHRDVKPSNVLVTRDGRVEILDFGLVSDTVREAEVPEDGLAGTPAYLSPEQCAGYDTSDASDWYSVGATLYHALTGRPPYEGSILDVIHDKTNRDPLAPAVAAPDVPDDLNDICMSLLARDPAQRMSGSRVVEKLRAGAKDETGSVRPDASASPFVGRDASLTALHAAFAEAKSGNAAVVYVHGPSGIGKTALLHHFFTGLGGEPIVTLRSRCHEHESVPYKGLDGVIDSLSRFLMSLPAGAAASLMPRDAFPLARLFPVMQIESILAQTGRDTDDTDELSLRKRAFIALCQLLDTIARWRPLIVMIDDFQWADADSAAALIELLRPPNPPPLLLLVAFRTEDIHARPFLRALIDQAEAGTRMTLELDPLTDVEVTRLIESLLPSGTTVRDGLAREAGGNPYLVEELARYARLGRDPQQGATLDDMLATRLGALPPGAQTFVEMLAICGRPMLAARIFEAAGLTGDERPLMARLRAAHFVRGSRSSEHVELYHDRIRETIAGRIPAQSARHIHAEIARTLVAHGDDDPEALFDHYRGAGEHRLAAYQAARAALRAAEVLAFDRAAVFYRHALDLEPETGERAQWTIGLARAYENAGRPPDAAAAYLAAARETTGIQRIEWLRKGAEQLLMGGHIDRGLETIHAVLSAVGIRLAKGPRAAVASIVIGRAKLAWRGLDFTERAEEDIAKEDLLRIDTCWALATGLMLVDTPCAASFNLKELLIALDAGEPYRIARALALEASFSVAAGGKAAIQRSGAFIERARRLAHRVHNPHLVALSLMTAGLASFLQGQWKNATELCDQALAMFREQCTGVVWEMTLAQNFHIGSLIFRGQFKYANDVLPRLLASARERGNLYYATELTTRMSLVWLARDAADENEREAADAMAQWSDSGFHRQHYNHFMARAQTALYRGKGQQAWTVIGDHWPIIRRNLWLQVQYNRIETAFLRARAAMAIAGDGHDVRHMCDVALRDADRLSKEQMLWADALAMLVRGTVAHLRGDSARAVAQLDEALDRFDRAEMLLYAAVTRRRLASLVDGDRGLSLRRESDAFMTEQDIRNPAAMSRLIAPGFATDDAQR